MFKIALKGLLGRKKESFMLLSILFLSFLFSILTSTFYSNSESAKDLQRRKVYGQWEYAAYGVPEKDDPFKEWTGIRTRGSNRIIGHSSSLGTLASFDEGFLKLANLNLLEGRMPSAVDEVALEQNQLSFFEKTPALGDKILSDTEIFLLNLEMFQTPDEIRAMIQDDATVHILAEMNPTLRRVFRENLGSGLTDHEFEEKLKVEMAKHIGIMPGNRRSQRGLEHFEDTLLLADQESLTYNYELNLMSLIAGQDESMTPLEQAELIKRINEILAEQLMETTGGLEDAFTIMGEGELPFKQSYIIRRTLTVTGIYSSISNAWLGDRVNLPTALVSEQTASKLIENGLMKTVIAQTEDFHVPMNHFISQSVGATNADSPQTDRKGLVNDSKIMANTLAFPPGNSTDGILALSMMGFIFFITLFGVFQLYMSQLKKRLRKLGLMRSVGATTGQIRQLLGWELVIILMITLPLALILGIGLAWLFSRGLGAGTVGYHFAIDPFLLAVSILSGIVAVILGVLQPLLSIHHISLTGRDVTVKTKKRPSVRQTLGEKVRPIKDLRGVLRHHNRFTRKQSVMTQVIYTVIFSMMVLSLLLSFLSFVNYRDEVVAVNMPDYDITFNYALNRKDTSKLEEELMATGAIADIQQILGRKAGQLTFEDWVDPLYEKTKAVLPSVLEAELFITTKDLRQYPEYFTAGARKVSVYGIKTDSNIFRALDLASGGLLNSDAFKTGTAALMLYPAYLETTQAERTAKSDELTGQKTNLVKALFEQTGLGPLSFDFRESPLMNQVDRNKVPGEIHLTFNSEVNSEIERNITPPSLFNLNILSVITQLPEFGVWPFSSTLEHPVIIGSEQMIRDMTESSQSVELLTGIPANQTLIPTLYGTQQTSLWTGSGKTTESFLTVQQIAHHYGGRVNNLLSDKEVRFNSALRISIMVLIVAFVIGLAALSIQLNISKARVEAERLYVGTLQSLGVSNQKLKLAYVKTGLGYSLVAVFLSHLIYLGVLISHTLISYPRELVQTSLISLIGGELWLYPWIDHLVITLIFLILGTLIYYLPLRRILKFHPINNIRQL